MTEKIPDQGATRVIGKIRDLHDRCFAVLENTLGDWFIPLGARILFAMTLMIYYLNSAATKLGEGVFGVFARHPILNMSLPWYFRGALIGGWMNLLLVLFAYDQFVQLTDSWNHAYGLYISPYWLILEGVIIGMMMDYLLTRWFGERLPNGS